DPKRALSKKRRPGKAPVVISRRHLAAAGCAILILAGVVAGLWLLGRWNTREASDITAAPVSLPDKYADRFLELNAMLTAVRERLSNLNEPTRPQREQMETAAARLREAEEKRNAGDITAVALAEEALEYYLAALIAPASMTFVPSGQVTVDGVAQRAPAFYIDKTEVTLREFAQFCAQVEDGWPLPDELTGAGDMYGEHPVHYVTWFDAQAYAVWKKKALPTRAQWARAAYGNPQASDIYPWGGEWQTDAANVQTNNGTQPVRSFKSDATWSGCFDMAGNVMEWTRTAATNNGKNAFPDFGDSMFVCGGSFLTAQPLRGAALRPVETRSPDLGFRCVIEIATTAESVALLLDRAK
ncbi:MAG TPA: hypothetical protein ENN65_09075, partial [Candidatus Hydrogenedentes bacterium]|nr:hypothetical protein [Candidatus Hydrogenedentota bacterium]